MALRLFHKLFLVVIATALVSAFAMAALLSWNLTLGFGDYLVAEDRRQLTEFADKTSTAVLERLPQSQADPAQSGLAKTDGVKMDPDAKDVLLREALENVPGFIDGPRSAGFNQGPRSAGFTGPPPRLQSGERPPPRRPPRPEVGRGDFAPSPEDGLPPQQRRRPPQNFADRVMVFAVDGTQLVGPPPPATQNDFTEILEVPVIVRGEIFAIVRLLPRVPEQDSIGRSFLARQYRSAAVVTCLLIGVGALFAYFLAKRSVARIADIQNVTGQIAKGELNARVGDLKASDELAAMAGNINDMAASLQKLEGARRRWLAEIGHELRTPITVLVGEIEALQDGVRPINASAIDSLSQEAGRLALLIEDLQFLAMSDLSKPPCKFGQADAVEIVNTVAKRFAPQMKSQGLELSVAAEVSGMVQVLWDAKRVDQLLANLLTNSRRYTDAPGQIHLNLNVQVDQVIIVIEDSAPGVPSDAMEKLFEPLFRIEGSRDRASGGSGLGLSVSQSIARAHGGALSAHESSLGGLAIHLTLPIDARPGGDGYDPNVMDETGS